MEDYAVDRRLKGLTDEIRELHDEVEKLRKRKANGDDVEHLVAKVGALETEVRTKFGSLQGQTAEVLHAIKSLNDNVDNLRSELAHQKREVSTLQETSKGSVWARIPMMAWVLMGIGGFAILQLGIERWAEIKGALP